MSRRYFQGAFILLSTLILLSELASGEKDTVKIVFGGDVEFTRMIEYLNEKKNCTYNNTLSRLKPYLEDADYALVNLETTARGKHADLTATPHKLVSMRSDETALDSLRNIGVKGVNIANNHLGDYQEAGVNETIASLRRYQLSFVGVSYGEDAFTSQKPLVLTKNGLKVGILGYCHNSECHDAREKYRVGPALFNNSNLITEANNLRQSGCDIVILFMHWGAEYTSVLGANVLFMIRHILRGAKIDLIVGSHPHVVHEHWYVNNTLVATSLGNLLFTPYLQANLNFNKLVHNLSRDAYYEQIAYKQSLLMKDPTTFGRLLKVEFNKYGIVKDKTMYLNTEVASTKDHCVVTRKRTNARWKTVCREKDPQCIGTDDCNYLECDHKDPLPPQV